ncbi:hypothetical protein AB0M10_33935 [Streptomyces sp. NPDC051840]|uniref:hypothetical protein n=1 Tax=Streptomyces sp. NPDC051840 TaxID=3154752 RepID=UPI003436E1B9
MAGTQPKLQWRQAGQRGVDEGGQLNGEFEKDGEITSLFHIKVSGLDETLHLHTSLPGKFRVGAYGFRIDSVEHGKAYAEEVLRDFYRTLKRYMEPAKPRKATAAAKGAGRG